jgi:hypothetical protein
VYEVAGAAHVDFRLVGDLACGYEVSRFPMHHLFKSTLARLDAWAVRDVTPPASRRIALNADGSVMLDEHGNALGGVRTTYTDVPTARYFDNPGCSLVGAQERFSPEKLRALPEPWWLREQGRGSSEGARARRLVAARRRARRATRGRRIRRHLDLVLTEVAYIRCALPRGRDACARSGSLRGA